PRVSVKSAVVFVTMHFAVVRRQFGLPVQCSADYNFSQNVLNRFSGEVSAMHSIIWRCFCGTVCLSIAIAVIADDSANKKSPAKGDAATQEARAASQEALAGLNPLVGEWRGVGQPVRNSNKGSWSEKAEWVWDIKKDHLGVRYIVKEGKLLANALITW